MTDVRRRLLSRIGASGPIPFDEFMDAALYEPGGFFAGERLRSVKAGDFLTSPEVSPRFGAMVARFVSSERERQGEPFRLVEVGAGSGSLIVPLLAELDVEAWAVEVSPAARATLVDALGAARVVESLESAAGRGVVVANELLDNFPMAVAVRRSYGWAEQYVEASGQDLTMIERPARPAVRAWVDRFAGAVAEGALVEVQLRAWAWVQEVLDRPYAVTLLLIDYGGTTEELQHRRTTGTLRTYRAHHLGPDPLAAPGETDITADVNFSALAAAAEAVGASARIQRQDEFLSGLGLRAEISDLRRRELDHARSGEEMARLRVRSTRTEAETLLNPRGLGDFRVLIAQNNR